MEELVPLIQKLKLADEDLKKETCLENLAKLVSENEEKSEDIAVLLVDSGILENMKQLLEESKSPQLSAKCAQLIAELAKSESLRQPLVDLGFISPLLKSLTSDYLPLPTQSCRALGNICYDNDAGRNVIDESDGIKLLTDLLRSQLKVDREGSEKLRTIACGFLLNLTNTHDVLQEKALDNGVLDILDVCLTKHLDDEGLTNMTLLTFSSLSDSDSGREKISECAALTTLVDLLVKDKAHIHIETILDILITLTECETIKENLASTNLSNHLIQIIQSNVGKSDSDSQQKIKMASDLMVSLLVGDKSMEMLFGNGDGQVFVESVKWLSSENDHLKTSGALAIGNFARSDEHCRLLVENGIVEHLLKLLEVLPTDSNMTLLHAALSALRNLAIPASNKPRLLEAGVMPSVLKLANTESMPVVFKILGVSRMLIDGQEEAAKMLGGEKDFLVHVVEWCDVEEHAGVRGEATRLLAWLIKNSKSPEVMKNIIKSDGIQYLVSMATSEHVVMQNEALIALTLICSTVLEDAADQLKEADLAKTVTDILKNSSTLPEILYNTLTLTKTICSAASPTSPQMLRCSLLACTGFLSDVQSNLREEIVTSGIADTIKQLVQHKDPKVQEAAKTVLDFIEEASANT
ncbi:rap1 GTPase-GDP dissociation stimulator 1 isoform X1 [Patella vulgata]|uniref:rap1 GTPase-GDP dissociation stimulator 1 isoform X1 n=1 Tax=Patella vulgata TaxID=6465 RepID=UPI00217F3AC1|nr:rap1 GTPase-GDP dissociation stimulator 1 isoform X1 [Patella vulgata]